MEGKRYRQAPPGKVKEAPRRLSDLVREEAKVHGRGSPPSPARLSNLVRKNAWGPLPVQDDVGSADGRLERHKSPSKKTSIEHPVAGKRAAPKGRRYEEPDAPEQVFQKAVDTMGGVLKAARARSAISISGVETVAEHLVDHLEAGDALLVPVFAAGSSYPDPAREAVHVCILAVKLALELGYTADELRQLSLAALFHDVGMARLPEELVEKKGRLNPLERASLARHPEEGVQIIWGLGPEYTWLADIVLQVHERVDGSGYPRALTGIEVQENAQIIGLADVYESLVHERPYRQRLSPVEALKEVLHRERTAFPDRILKALIQAMSPYPVGSLVRLNTGEMGRVVARNKARPLRPVVEVRVRGGKEIEEPAVIDLSQSPLITVQDSVLEESLS